MKTEHARHFHHVQLMDTTLRDGSYAISFRFTAEDTQSICSVLDAFGVPWIEVGHGVGLGASRKGFGRTAVEEVEYIKAASAAVRHGRIGAFCIPGIAELDDLRRAADLGLQFLRVGANVGSVDTMAPFVALAKELGLFVCCNFMKSYVMTPEDVGQLGKQVEGYGADAVYVVDSAGGMLPDQVRAYCQAMREACGLQLGFHGHDNLNLAVANSLAAIEAGAAIIDGSLQGLGRSAGNAPTETLLLLLKQVDDMSKVASLLQLIDFSEKTVRPLLRHAGSDSLDLISGVAQFHTSYMPIIAKYAEQYEVDPRMLIVAVCRIRKDEAPEDLVEQQARQLAEVGATADAGWFPMGDYVGKEQSYAERKDDK